MIVAYTDYPFEELGDEPYKKAPVREIKVLSFDGNKYCRILVGDMKTEIKAGYIYTKPGRCDEVPNIGIDVLESLIKK